MARRSKTGVRGLSRSQDGGWTFDLRWREANGERRRHQERWPATVPAPAAKMRAREMTALALAGGWQPKTSAPRRLAEAFDQYMDWAAVNRPAGVSKRRAACDRLLAVIGSVAVGEISPFAIERFKKARTDAGAAPATVNRDLEVLTHFYGLAASWDWCSREKADAVRRVPHLKEPPGRVRYLTGDEEARLMGALPVRVRRIVTATLLSGMRQSEVVLLRKNAVDLQGKVITLTRTKANKLRRIYVNDAFARLLEEAIADSREGVQYVFTNRAGEPYTPDGVRSIFRRGVQKAGILNFHFHDLRHTTATRLRQRGVGIDAIADVLGHSSLAMAQRYAHLGRDTLREAMASLPTPAMPATPEPKQHLEEKKTPRRRLGSVAR